MVTRARPVRPAWRVWRKPPSAWRLRALR